MTTDPRGTKLQVVRVFLGSPGDLKDDRQVVRRTVDEYNNTDANRRGFHFEVVGWEDTTRGLGRPQDIINDLIPECHYSIFLLGSRWGSPPSAPDSDSAYTSGTEEEIDLAVTCGRSPHAAMRDVVLLLKPIPPELLADPDDQVLSVIEFKRRIEKEKSVFYRIAESDEETARLVRKRLGLWLYELEGGSPLDFTQDTTVEPPDPFRIKSGSPSAQIDRAWQLASEGRLVDAEVAFSKAVTERGTEWDFVEYAEFLLREGRVQQAEAILEEVATSAHAKDELARCAALNALGRLKQALGDLQNAERLVKESVDLGERLGQRSAVGSGLAVLGTVEMSKGSIDTADEYFRRALLIKTAVGDGHGVAALLVNRALVAHSRCEWSLAERGLLEAQNTAATSGDPILQAGVLSGLALVYMDTGRLSEAEAALLESMRLEEASGHKVGVASDLGNLGSLRLRQGDHAAALQCFRKAVEANRELGRLEGVANQLGNVAMVLQRQGHLDAAEAAFREAVETFVYVGHLDNAARERIRHARLVKDRGDADQAAHLLKEFIDVVQERTAAGVRLRLALAQVLFESGRLAESRQELQVIVNICDEHGLEGQADHARDLIRLIDHDEAGGSVNGAEPS